MITAIQEALLIKLLRQHDTPTEAVRKALKADACEIHLTCRGQKIIVRDVNWRKPWRPKDVMVD